MATGHLSKNTEKINLLAYEIQIPIKFGSGSLRINRNQGTNPE